MPDDIFYIKPKSGSCIREIVGKTLCGKAFPSPQPSPGGRGSFYPSPSGRRARDEGLRLGAHKPTAFSRLNSQSAKSPSSPALSSSPTEGFAQPSGCGSAERCSAKPCLSLRERAGVRANRVPVRHVVETSLINSLLLCRRDFPH